MVEVKGTTKVRSHSKRIHVITEPPEQPLSTNVVTACTYADLKPGSSRVTVFIRNISAKEIKIWQGQ